MAEKLISSDHNFQGNRVRGLPVAIAAGEPATYEQLARPNRPGIFYCGSRIAFTPGTLALTANVIRAFPFWLGAPLTPTSIRSDVATLLAGTQYRVGLYTDNGQVYPGDLIEGTDAAEYSGATAGRKDNLLTGVPSLHPGWCWLVYKANGGPTVRTMPVTAIESVLGFQGNMGSNSAFTCWSLASTYSPLPATFPSGATLVSNLAAPLVLLS